MDVEEGSAATGGSQRYGAFEGAETAAVGGDSVETHDLAGLGRDGVTRLATAENPFGA